ncbi:MAG TPA: hypothetical protein VM915_15330 [Verrucomicrobiae bacterium]|nr:hypothetical protein [Verrucomicrobiae bacterium]
MSLKPHGAGAVMASRTEAPDSLDFFPTPPWATRALVECVLAPLGFDLGGSTVWEPAAGAGHMSNVLAEYARAVIASDVHDYGIGAEIGSFVGRGPDVITSQPADWIITNPPFNLAEEFFERARVEARGVALLVRTTWLESKERFEKIFAQHPPNVVALFSERVPMVKGRWNPKASTATSYAWVIWRAGSMAPGTRLVWIPPGQKQRLTLGSDYANFAEQAA